MSEQKRKIFYKIEPALSKENKAVFLLKIRIIEGSEVKPVSYEFETEESLQGFLRPFKENLQAVGEEITEEVEGATG